MLAMLLADANTVTVVVGIVLLIVGAVFAIIGIGVMLAAGEESTTRSAHVAKSFEPGRAVVGLVFLAVGLIIIVIGSAVLGWL